MRPSIVLDCAIRSESRWRNCRESASVCGHERSGVLLNHLARHSGCFALPSRRAVHESRTSRALRRADVGSQVDGLTGEHICDRRGRCRRRFHTLPQPRGGRRRVDTFRSRAPWTFWRAARARVRSAVNPRSGPGPGMPTMAMRSDGRTRVLMNVSAARRATCSLPGVMWFWSNTSR